MPEENVLQRLNKIIFHIQHSKFQVIKLPFQIKRLFIQDSRFHVLTFWKRNLQFHFKRSKAVTITDPECLWRLRTSTDDNNLLKEKKYRIFHCFANETSNEHRNKHLPLALFFCSNRISQSTFLYFLFLMHLLDAFLMITCYFIPKRKGQKGLSYSQSAQKVIASLNRQKKLR